MTTTMWNVTYRIHRQKGQEPPHIDEFTLEVNPDEYVLDGIERIWAMRDRSLTFRHACHHSTCGACGMRVNGGEKLTCITRIRNVTNNGGTITVEPLRNFPVISDLAVDMSALYTTVEQVGFPQIAPVASALAPSERKQAPATTGDHNLRLVDCIECGLCLSACPIMATAISYLGPAALAAAEHGGLAGEPNQLGLVDHQDGVWRCHNTFECSAVCPSAVDPAARIMQLRKQIVGERIKRLIRGGKESRR